MATLQERFDAVIANQAAAADQLTTTGTKLSEASAEILAELTKLREGGNLTPEQEASLATIEGNAGAISNTATALAQTASGLADVSPPLP